MSDLNTLYQEANDLFAKSEFEKALKKYIEARSMTNDPKALEVIDAQIAACKRPEPTESPKKKTSLVKKIEKKLGIKSFDPKKAMINSLIKGFLPKLEPMIEKNKPKALAFMRGEMDFQGNPVEDNPKERVIYIRVIDHPSGDPDKADVLVQILKKPHVRVQMERDPEGKNLAIEQEHSATQFLQRIISMNFEDIEEEINNADINL